MTVHLFDKVTSGTLVDGTAVILSMARSRPNATVWTVPVAGDTVTVSYSVDGGTTYTTWPKGAVTTASNDTLLGAITHIKFQRTGGSGITSTYGVTQ